MPLPDVVRTCILSKRWKRLWASVQSLEFKNLHRITNFENFVNSLLMQRELLDVSTFRLKLPERYDESINVWIVYAINHGAKVLDLEFDRFVEEGYELPDRLFTSQTLEELCVRHIEGIIGFPRSISLKGLKKLHVSFLELCSGDVQNMISGCPMIESLHIEMCEISCASGKLLDIYSRTLKHLKIEDGRVSGVRFHTPNLLRLHYEWHFVDVAWFDDMPYLDYAVLVCGDDGFDVIVAGIAGIIMPVASTKTLKLSGTWVDRIPMGSAFPTFKNLKNLTVEKSCMSNLRAVAVIMQYTPNLEELTVKQIMEDEHYCFCDTCYADEMSVSSDTSAEGLRKFPFTCPKLTAVDFQYDEDRLCSSDLIEAFAECFLISPELKEKVIKILSCTFC